VNKYSHIIEAKKELESKVLALIDAFEKAHTKDAIEVKVWLHDQKITLDVWDRTHVKSGPSLAKRNPS
jgi:hypothetical protein